MEKKVIGEHYTSTFIIPVWNSPHLGTDIAKIDLIIWHDLCIHGSMITQFTLKDGTSFILVLWGGHCTQPPTAVLRYSSVSDNFTKGEQRQCWIDCGCSQEVTHSTITLLPSQSNLYMYNILVRRHKNKSSSHLILLVWAKTDVSPPSLQLFSFSNLQLKANVGQSFQIVWLWSASDQTLVCLV